MTSPIPDHDPWGQGNAQRGLQGLQMQLSLHIAGLQAWDSAPSVVRKPAIGPGILALTPSTLAPPSSQVPAWAGSSNGLLALCPSTLLKYLSDHYVFSGREWRGAGQKATLLWPDARVNYRLDKSTPPT
jgi:hypothetical protein